MNVRWYGRAPARSGDPALAPGTGRSQESELRSQKLQELQNMRARSLSENPGQASPWENLRRNPDSLAPELLQLLNSGDVESGTPSKFQRSER